MTVFGQVRRGRSGAEDQGDHSSLTIRYGSQYGPGDHTVEVTVTVTVHYPDQTTVSRSESKSMDVRIRKVTLGTPSATKGTICVGSIHSEPHRTDISVSVHDGFGSPAQWKTVTFNVTGPSKHSPAWFWPSNQRSTGETGTATATLISSDKIGDLSVTVSAEGQTSDPLVIHQAFPDADQSPDPPIELAMGEDELLSETLTYGGAAVDQHTLYWSIDRVRKPNGYVVQSPGPEYGNLNPAECATDGNGVSSSTYTTGTKPGLVYIKVADGNAYETDGTRHYWEIEVQVNHADLQTFEPDRDPICAGAKASPAHRCTLTAYVDNGNGGPAEGIEVSFEIVEQDFVTDEASLSTAGPLLTDFEGHASVVLTSSDQAGSVTVRATVEGDDPVDAVVSIALPESTPDPDDVAVIHKMNTKGLQETLTLGGLPVSDHNVIWFISEIYDVDGNLVTSPPTGWYGDVDPWVTETSPAGIAQTTYTPGSELGTIIIQAEDHSCHDSAGEFPALDTFIVVVATLDGLQVDNAIQLGDTNHYATAIDADGEVLITAIMRPMVPGDAEGVIQWTGATPVAGNGLQAVVPKTPAGTTEVTAHFAMSMEQVIIHVCQVTAIGTGMPGGPWGGEDYLLIKADPDNTTGCTLKAWLYPELTMLDPPHDIPEQLLIWEPNLGGPYNDHADLRNIDITEPARYDVTVHCGDSSESVTIFVVGLEMSIATKEIYVNSDDDNDSGASDLNESPVDDENDLALIETRILPTDAPLMVLDQNTIMHSWGVEVWEDPEKHLEVGWWLPYMPYYMYVEGRQVSAQTDDQWVNMNVFVRDPMWEEWVLLELEATVNLTVLPREGESEAYFKLYKDTGLTQEVNATGKIGGTVYPVLYVALGPGCKVADQSTIIRVTDLYDQYFNQTIYTHDLVPGPDYLSFTDATGWEREQSDGTWAEAPAGEPPNSNANQGGADRMVYRYKMTWLTHWQPLGNNGPHRLEADPKITFQKYTVGSGWGDDEEVGPSTLEPECENVYVESCTANPGNIDYFKWDPEDPGPMSAPRITFQVVDADPHKYCGIIRFKGTGAGTAPGWYEAPDWRSMRFDLGSSTTGNIELTVPDSNGDCLTLDDEWGTYKYDVLVIEYDGAAPVWTQVEALDWNFVKRYRDGYHLWVPESLPPPDEGKAGHDVWFADEGMRAYYRLESAHALDAEDVQIVVVDPVLAEQGSTSGPREVGVNHGVEDGNGDGEPDGIALNSGAGGEAGVWRGVFTAADAAGHHSPNWRTHDAVRMLPANAKDVERHYWVLVDPGHGKIWNKDSNPGGPPTETAFRGGTIGTYVEANVVLAIANRMVAELNTGPWNRHIGGASMSRIDEWDIGQDDSNAAVGGALDVGDEVPVGERSLDRRVRWAKTQQKQHWENGNCLCLFLSLHTNGGSPYYPVTPLIKGVFHIRDIHQERLVEAGTLGDYALTPAIRELMGEAPAGNRFEEMQVPFMVSSILHWDPYHGGAPLDPEDEHDAKLLTLEGDPYKCHRMPAVILELGHHTHDTLIGMSNRDKLETPALRSLMGKELASGVSDYATDYPDW